MGRKGSTNKQIHQYLLGARDSGGLKLLACTSLMLINVINAAYAQQSEGESEGEPSAANAVTVSPLPTITVSARGGKTQEDPKDLPFGITLVSGEEIEERGLTSIEDVLRATPGVNVNSSGGANVSSLYIRGIGALYPMSMDDTSVAVNLDGSPLSSRHISLGNLDVEHVEVLKGSQGTLFGGLAEAGAINITTRKPTRHVEGYARGEYGQEGQHLVAGAIGGPLTDQLSGRIAIQQSAFDYPITNLQTGEPVAEPDLLALRGSLMWDATPNTSVLVSTERQKARYMGENIVLRPYGNDPAMDVSPGIYANSHKTVERSSLQVDHELDNSQFTAVTSYTDGFNTSPVVYDRLIQASRTGNPNATEYWLLQESHEQVITQDLRLSSLPDARIFWVGGLSLLHSDRSYDNPRNTYGTSNAQFRDFNTQRYGIYGETTLPISRDWKLTAGLRHTWDSKTFDATYLSGGASTSESETLSDNFTTGRIGLTHALTPEVNVYSMLSRGYNPGGFQDYGNAPGTASYRAATSKSAELGFKSAMAEQRLTLNGALFYTDVEDNHLLSYDSATYAVSAVNADTRSMGAELQASWQFDNGLTLSGDVSYIDAEITTDAFGIGDGDVHAGNHIPDIPRWSSHFALSYQRQVSPFLGISSPLLNARLDYNYQGARPADPQNSFDLDAYHKIDMRLGVGSGDTEWYVWGRNLMDEHYDLYGYFAPPSTYYGAPAQGRAFGLGVNHTF